MQDKIYGQILRKLAFERWENEGGRICTGPAETSAETSARFSDQRTEVGDGLNDSHRSPYTPISYRGL